MACLIVMGNDFQQLVAGLACKSLRDDLSELFSSNQLEMGVKCRCCQTSHASHVTLPPAEAEFEGKDLQQHQT